MAWYILIVRPGFEQTINEQLILKQEELCIQESYVSSDLSGYIFIRSIEISSRHANNFLVFDGVIKFLGTKNSGPQKFTTSQINKLKIDNIIIKPSKSTNFKVGDFVIIKHGDLSDIDGEIIEIRKRIVRIKPSVFSKIVKTRIQDIEHI